jgi:hypothetical protein
VNQDAFDEDFSTGVADVRDQPVPVACDVEDHLFAHEIGIAEGAAHVRRAFATRPSTSARTLMFSEAAKSGVFFSELADRFPSDHPKKVR